MKNIFLYHTTIGPIAIAEKSSSITNVFMAKDISEYFTISETDSSSGGPILVPRATGSNHQYNYFESGLLKEAAEQLYQYLDGKLKSFILPLAPEGTGFMKSVWDELLKIPYSRTASYKEIAQAVGNPKASRAVGLANNRNPIPIIVPCHRVVGISGKLVGYRGGLETKRKLLELEGCSFAKS